MLLLLLTKCITVHIVEQLCFFNNDPNIPTTCNIYCVAFHGPYWTRFYDSTPRPPLNFRAYRDSSNVFSLPIVPDVL